MNALDIALQLKDLPPKYLLEYQEGRTWEGGNRIQSHAMTIFHYGDPDVGPTFVNDEVAIFCTEQLSADFWPTAKANLRDDFPSITEESKLEIGDATYVVVYKYRHTIWYGLVFREKNAVVFMHAEGVDGVLDLDIVENLADIIDAKLEPSTLYLSSN